MAPLRISLLAGLVGLAGGCDWERCDAQALDFELAEPGDAVELRIEACPDRGKGDLSLDMSITAEGTPASSFALLVDGIVLQPESSMRWVSSSVFELLSDEDCNRVISLRRTDADPGIVVQGHLDAEMSAPQSRTCSVALTSQSPP